MATSLTTADLPASMRVADAEVSAPARPTLVLLCQHGPACPSCVLAEARRIVATDASLTDRPYTG